MTQNNTMLVYSGMAAVKGSVAPDNSLIKLEIDTWTWKKGTWLFTSSCLFTVNPGGTSPSPRVAHAYCLLPNNVMMIFGGTVVLYDYNDVFMYDCNTDTWISGFPGKVQGNRFL
jgi:hypothetical protein